MCYLLANSYTVVPIAPGSKQILGQTCYASLADVPAELRAKIDLVDVFRKSDALPGVWSEVKQHLPNVKLVWLQNGLHYDAGAQEAQSKGVEWVQNKCIMVEHRQLFNVPRSLL
jgi:predicted CoA-binding protein